MSHLPPGLIGAYNSLTDKHLTGYFNNARIRRHLQRVGLISRSGRIVSEKEFRYRIIHKDQQRHVRECLAQAIFHRVLDMERLHQTEIRRKLEECVRRERVNKVKVERCNRYEDDPLIFFSPRPPTRLRNSHALHSGPEREPSDSTDSLDSSRPNTAPEKTQRPLRLKPLTSNGTPTSTKRNSSHYQDHVSTNDGKQQICSVLDGDVMRHLTLTDVSSSASPYRLPVINNFVTPVPPLKRRDKVQNGTLRGRRLRPTTAPSDAPVSKWECPNCLPQQEGAVQRAWSRTAVWVKMVYFGKSVHLSHDLMELKDEVKVFQQHCGGENLCVYKGRLKEGESFQFMSRRHRGFPFSLTFYLNGLQVERLSSCCEFKHRKNSRLGGRHAHFGFSGVEGAAPCYRCIIAMGLDKKPAPPNRIRNNLLDSKSWEKEDEEEKPFQSESSQSHLTDPKRNSDQERKHKNGYEEDFEADDEGPMDDGVDEGNETSFNREEENERRKDENGLKDSNTNSVRGSSSVSSGLTSTSCSSEEGEGEFDEEQKEEEVRSKRHTPTSTSEKDGEETDVLQTSSVSLPTEDKTQNQKIEHTERDNGEAEKSIEEAGEDKEPGNAAGEDDKPRDRPGETEEPREEPEEAEKPRKEPEEAEEPEVAEEPREEHEEAEKSKGDFREGMAQEINGDGDRVKSVQEKLAEAILNLNECVSEPELSDTTTEEDELVLVVTQRAGPGAESENNVAQQTADEENGAELVQAAKSEKEYTEEPKEETATQETSQAETKTQEEEKETNQTEEKTHSTANEDERADDVQNLENKDHNTEVRQDITADEGGQIQEDDNFSNLQNKSNVEPENTEEPPNEEPPDEELRDGNPPGDELRDGDPPGDELRDEEPPDEELPYGDPSVEELLDEKTPDEKVPDEELPNGDPPVEELLDEKTPDEKVPDEELPNGDPPVEELLDGEPPDEELQKLPKESPTENSVNAEESRATPVENEDNVMEEITENTKSSSENHGNVDQNTEIEKVNEEELGGGEEVSVEEIKDNKEKTFEEESENLRNSSAETNIDIAEYVEGSMEDPALNEVKDEDLAGEDEKSEERVVLSETVEEKEQIEEGEESETDMRNAMEVIRDQDQVKEDENTEEGNRGEEKINHGMTEDVADQNELTPTSQTTNKKAENEVRKREELEVGFTAENYAGLQEELGLGSEGKNKEEDKHKEELEEDKSFKEHEVGKNEWHMSESEADVDMQGPLIEQQENHEEQIHGSDPSLHDALPETTDGPEVKSGELIQDKKEGPGEGVGTFESSEEINQDMDEEVGVKAEQMDEDNKQVDQKEIQQEIPNEEEKQEKEEEEVGVKGNEQKQTVEKAEADEKANLEQEIISDREIKEEQKEELDNLKPLLSESSNDTANEHEAPSDAKTPVEDPAGANSERKNTNAEFEGRAEDESKASPGSNIQSSTDIKNEKSADAAEETRRLEGSVSPAEESQSLEKVLAVKRDEREPELIVTPRTNHEELVSNWVVVHQASKYFETFVEPLDEIKINDGERSMNTEALEVDEMMQSPKDSEEKEESSEAAKDDQIILPVNSEHEELQDTTVENSNMEAEAIGAEGEHYQSSGNPSEETEDRRQMNSELTPEDQECVELNNVIDVSATLLMKIEISQDS